MKKSLLLILIIFSSCSRINGVNPSQNKAVNLVAGKTEKKTGFLQKSLDNWLKTEWEPTTSTKSKHRDENRSFTLQEYVDKLDVYNNSHVTDEKNSHYNRVNNMPVIGKAKN
jgi:hypothetical protein